MSGEMNPLTGLVSQKTWQPPAKPEKAVEEEANPNGPAGGETEEVFEAGGKFSRPASLDASALEGKAHEVPEVAVDSPARVMNPVTGFKPRKTWHAKKAPMAGGEIVSPTSEVSDRTSARTIDSIEGLFPKTPGVIMVTGASRGIGLALCKYFAKNHPEWQLIAAVRSPDSDQVKNDLKKFWITKNDVVVKMDIDDEQSVADCFKEVSSKFGHIDILINNAGIASKNHPVDPVLEIDAEDFMKVFRVNVLGTWRVSKHFLPLLRKAPTPKVVNLSSDLGSLKNNEPGNRIGQPAGGKASYRSTKAALNMLTRTFAVEVPEVAFMAMSPGWVKTRMGGSGNRQPPLNPDQSAARLLKMIMTSSLKNSGSFWSATNEKEWELEF